MLLAEDWGVGEVLWTMIWFTMLFIWIWLLIVVFSDIFRSHDIGGFAKFLWVAGIIIFPFLGVFIYLIARGHKMSEHAMEAARRRTAASAHTSRMRPERRPVPPTNSRDSPTSRRRV